VFCRHLSQSGGVVQAPSEWTWRGAFKAAVVDANTLRLVLRNFKPDVAYEFKVRQSYLYSAVLYDVACVCVQHSGQFLLVGAQQCSALLAVTAGGLLLVAALPAVLLIRCSLSSPPGRFAGPHSHNRIRHRPSGSLPSPYSSFYSIAPVGTPDVTQSAMR
jgi:hypothetical protein